MIERIILTAEAEPTGPSWIVACMPSAASAAAPSPACGPLTSSGVR